MNRVPLVASLVSLSAGETCLHNKDACIQDNNGENAGDRSSWVKSTDANSWNMATGTGMTEAACRDARGRFGCLPGHTMVLSDIAHVNNALKAATDDSKYAKIATQVGKDSKKEFEETIKILADGSKSETEYWETKDQMVQASKGGKHSKWKPYAGKQFYYCVNTTGCTAGNVTDFGKAGTKFGKTPTKTYADVEPTVDAPTKRQWMLNMEFCMAGKDSTDATQPGWFDGDCCAREGVGSCAETDALGNKYMYVQGEANCNDDHYPAVIKTDKSKVNNVDRNIGGKSVFADSAWKASVPGTYYTTKCFKCDSAQIAAGTCKNKPTTWTGTYVPASAGSAATISVFGALSSAVMAFMLV